MARLTPQQVLRIRELYAAGNGINALATAFGRHPGTISNLVHRRSHKRVRETSEQMPTPRTGESLKTLVERVLPSTAPLKAASVALGAPWVHSTFPRHTPCTPASMWFLNNHDLRHLVPLWLIVASATAPATGAGVGQGHWIPASWWITRSIEARSAILRASTDLRPYPFSCLSLHKRYRTSVVLRLTEGHRAHFASILQQAHLRRP